MRHRFHLLFALVAIAVAPTAARAERIDLRFEDVAAYAASSSPLSRIIDRQSEMVTAERDAALSWSNPGLAYGREGADGDREWTLTLAKRLEKPLGRSRLSKGWDGRLRAADLRAESRRTELAAELRLGYVRIGLMRRHEERLEDLAAIVDLVAGVARDRGAQGELSALSAQLVELTALSLESELRHRHHHRKLLAADWRAELGVPDGVDLDLATPIAFTPIDLDALGALDPSDRPAARADAELAAALGTQAAAARPDLLPSLEIFGGFKRFDSDAGGYVAGLAIDLPLFGRRGGESGRLAAERRIVEQRRRLELDRARGEIDAMIHILEEDAAILHDFTASLIDAPPRGDTLLLAFREGALSLDELLGAIQIETGALATYFESLADYYDHVFRLEALTGLTLARFADEES